MKTSYYFLFAAFLFMWIACSAQPNKLETTIEHTADSTLKQVNPIVPAAYLFNDYINLLSGKKVAVVVNQTSMVGNTHLVDTLMSQGITIVKIFAPEHGFRGNASAGEKIDNTVDEKTGVPIISLYGKSLKPTPQMLEGVDIVVFDIQDVGVRFYTYISTMHYAMEACAENKLPFVVLDRPNPNGDYVDGQILDTKYQSFVGMHPIPVVHGCTVGELAKMINGEHWLKGGIECNLTVVAMKNYAHHLAYSLPVRPSPNLPNDLSIRLYPSLCFFEGTIISLGRGTEFPFQVAGFPDKSFGDFSFTPQSIDGVAANPPQEGKMCYGIDLRNEPLTHRFTIKYLIDFYNLSKDKKGFFLPSNFIDKLAGGSQLREQIVKGMNENEIRATWKDGLDKYMKMREKYLLYE